eukprot:GHVR01026641.1.p1 GENE.GHVR01026641.1~~GHVR01026641.1.p1  ORF type:complete len:195 (+),score=35.80 GHVR01026641.1:379-963(+)
MDINSDNKLKMDTRRAKASLRELERAKQRAQRSRHGKATQARRRSGRRGIGGRTFAKGAGVAAGYAIVSRLTRTGEQGKDPWMEQLTVAEAALRTGVDMMTGTSARAMTAAREETKEAYGLSVGLNNNEVPPGMNNFYQRSLALNDMEQKGLNILRLDPRFAGPLLDDLLKQAIPGYFTLVGKSFQYIYDALTK